MIPPDPMIIRAACESLTCPVCGERLQYQEQEPVTWEIRGIRRGPEGIVIDCDPNSQHGWYEAQHTPSLSCTGCPWETPLPAGFTATFDSDPS